VVVQATHRCGSRVAKGQHQVNIEANVNVNVNEQENRTFLAVSGRLSSSAARRLGHSGV